MSLPQYPKCRIEKTRGSESNSTHIWIRSTTANLQLCVWKINDGNCKQLNTGSWCYIYITKSDWYLFKHCPEDLKQDTSVIPVSLVKLCLMQRRIYPTLLIHFPSLLIFFLLLFLDSSKLPNVIWLPNSMYKKNELVNDINIHTYTYKAFLKSLLKSHFK